MAKTYSDLLQEVKQSVRLVSLEDLKARLDSRENITLVDVREKDEWRQGYIPGCVHLPRGFLEMQAESRLPDTVFAATGDHWSRDFPNSRPDTYESNAVLMLWRGKAIVPQVADSTRLAGSHQDIVPTLVELAAPAGFTYHAFGGNLFDPGREQNGAGMHATIGPDFIIWNDDPDSALSLWDMQPRPAKPHELQAFKRWQAVRAVSWWRLRKGPGIGK